MVQWFSNVGCADRRTPKTELGRGQKSDLAAP